MPDPLEFRAENEKQIKLMLVMLAEYLQTTLTDKQVSLYSRELQDLGAEGVATAIKRLQADPSVWSGRFPLPAKLRSYLVGNIEDMALESAQAIMACNSFSDVANLDPLEQKVAKDYGLKTIMERSAGDSQTIFAQLRDALKAKYNREYIYGPRKAKIAIGSSGGQTLLREERTVEVRGLCDKDELRKDPASSS